MRRKGTGPPTREIHKGFLRPQKPRKTRVVVPMALQSDMDFEIIIRNDAYERGEVYIEDVQSGKRLATVRRDGTLEIHS
jgi:hypothetical protein